MNNRLLGSSLLIAGCSIGSGMLAIPVMSGAAGFFPSLLIFFIAWAVMTVAGLIYAQVTASFDEEVNLMSMAENVFSKGMKWATFAVYSSFFLSLLIAYYIATTRLIIDFAVTLFGVAPPFFIVSTGVLCLLLFFLIRGLRSVDHINRLLVAGLLLCYGTIIGVGMQHVTFDALCYKGWNHALFVLPVTLTAFGFQNLVPSLYVYLKKDLKQLFKAICIGSFLTLTVYILWQAVILGLMPFSTEGEWIAAQKEGHMVLNIFQQLKEKNILLFFLRSFTFFAVTSSFLPVAFSFFDFIRDGFKERERTERAHPYISFIVLFVPFCIALIAPSIFLLALSYVGGIAAMCIFVLLPAVIAWKKKVCNPYLLSTMGIIGTLIIIWTIIVEVSVL